MKSIREAMESLEADPWRQENGFSPDMQNAHDALWAADTTKEAAATCLNDWLKEPAHYPCVFGRNAAKRNQIGYCILSHLDLLKEDPEINQIIQAAHTEFLRQAHKGNQSAFVILACSPVLAAARPSSPAAGFIASSLVRFYLDLELVEYDKVYQAEIFLELPLRERPILRWKAGVNYFSAHGDSRWWHDHRIPGGIALSMNSVGHLLRSYMSESSEQTMAEALGINREDASLVNLKDKFAALIVAMQSVDRSFPSVSGKATRLYSREEQPVPASLELSQPLGSKLAPMNHCKYAGWYHTDHTLPSAFFRDEVARPTQAAEHELDFTYLFDPSFENLDYSRLTDGRRISSGDEKMVDALHPLRHYKSSVARCNLSECPALYAALQAS